MRTSRRSRTIETPCSPPERHGVAGDRVDVLPVMPLASFLSSIRVVDVALDPFPTGGGTTTLRTFWTGVPMVILGGDSRSLG
ncbi:MAG: hypothetical protein HS109_01920 [Burkholderiales bacterium]|nr:hypothetical protein [Burkholderiales bacterium]MCE7876175.1 hypothetical protein [Betaproteobacteria bacterium PRO3]